MRRALLVNDICIFVLIFVGSITLVSAEPQPGQPGKLRAEYLTGAWVMKCTPTEVNDCGWEANTSIWNIVASGDRALSVKITGDAAFENLQGSFVPERRTIRASGRSKADLGMWSSLWAGNSFYLTSPAPRQMSGTRYVATVRDRIACVSQFACSGTKQ